MGITGLLPFVKNSCRPANIRDFSGSTVAIDAYSWLHKGAFACAEKLVKGEKTDGYVFYCIKLLNMLKDAGLTPIMVFDGCNLASKAVTEKKRRENRDRTKQRGKELLCEGKIKEARECFQRCVDVTPEMAKEVIEACKKKSIDCIVAPYEADAQLAYLDKIGMAQLIITEDSDLVLFGCNRILFKMDGGGGGLLYEKENLPKSFGNNASKFSFEKFRYMCILSGCDYLPSLPGIGLAKACKFFSLTTITDLTILLSKLPSYLKMPRLVVSDEYKDSFIKANNTFLYQLAFCPKQKKLVPLNPYPEDVTFSDMEYAGKYLDDELAYQLAIGNINVKTLKEFDLEDSEYSSTFDDSKSVVWNSESYSKESNKPKNLNAFKFTAPKSKTESSQKRKFIDLVTEDSSELSPLPADDLFSQYSGKEAKRSRTQEFDEEDPLAPPYLDSPGESKKPVFDSTPPKLHLPLNNKIVKSRFFSPQSSQGSSVSCQSDISVASSNLTDDSGVFLSNSESDAPIISPVDNMDCAVVVEETIPKRNKEILNRFAKKKSPSFSPMNVDSVSPSTSGKESPLDVFNSEASSTTATLSSMQKCAKILSQEVKESAIKMKPKNLFCKDTKKLITTKIEDFKFSKDAPCKMEVQSKVENSEITKSPLKTRDDSVNSLPKENSDIVKSTLKENPDAVKEPQKENSDALKSPLKETPDSVKKPLKEKSDSVKSPLKENTDAVEKTIKENNDSLKSPRKEKDDLKSPQKEKTDAAKSPLQEISPYFVNNSDEPIYCIATFEESDDVIILNECVDSEAYEIKNIPKNSGKSSQNSQLQKSGSSSDKLNKCRTIGLSKTQKSGGKVQTLLNFNFTRKSVPVKSN